MPRVLRPALAVVALLLALLVLPTAHVRAATFVVKDQASCEALGGSINFRNQCAFNISSPLDVAAGDLVRVELSIIAAYFNNNGTIALEANTANVIAPNGGAANFGTITVASGASLEVGGDLTNVGTITVASGATLTAHPGFRNNGTITVACGGTVAGTVLGTQPVFTACTPTSKAQCKNGGYAQFTDPATKQPFANEGQCIQFVNTGK